MQDIGEPCVHLRVHKTDPVTKETTPITMSLSGDKFRLLLRGTLYKIMLCCVTEQLGTLILLFKTVLKKLFKSV